MVVIYAEKASLAKEIANALHAGKRIPLAGEPTVGHYEFKFRGEDAILCHGVGHLAQLVPAASYDEKFKSWDLNVYPCIPDNFRAAPKADTLKCMKLVKSFLDKADWCINACDADREGELIFAYICDVCHCNAPFKRVWIEDLTEQKLRYAFDNLKAPNQQLSPTEKGTASDLRLAGRARSIADWLIGVNLTVAATKKFGNRDKMLSVGRVQTPTLNLVVEREKAILGHKKTPFWKLTVQFQTTNEQFEAEYEKGNFQVEVEAQQALSECNGRNGIVTSIEIKHKTESVPLLYNATGLQIAANKKYGWDSEKTAKVMQSLYEKKLMSYPRTSSEHLTDAMKPEVTDTIKKLLRIPEYASFSIEPWAEFTKRHFDDAKVGSHPAIIPTVNVPETLNELSEDEKMLYDLLAKSLIRMIYPKAEMNDTTALITVNGKHLFKATGSVITADGWYAVDAKPEKKKVLPNLANGQELSGTYEVKKGVTEPPKRYTEAELLAAMETAGQKLEDEEARTLMKMQKKGLGTDATRVPTIKSLFQKGYLARKGKTIYPTELGIFLIDSLPISDLKSAEMTGEMEKKLNDIALGSANYEAFISEVKKLTATWYGCVSGASTEAFVSSSESKMLCPLCGKKLNTFDWGYSCSGYQEGCTFKVGKTIAGKKITENMVITLCQKGKSGLIKGFKSKSGKEFDAYLVVDKAKGEVGFQFPEKK